MRTPEADIELPTKERNIDTVEERKLKQFEIYKIATSRFTEKKGTKIKINPLTLTKREAVENGELVNIGITADFNGKYKFRYKDKFVTVEAEAGKEIMVFN